MRYQSIALAAFAGISTALAAPLNPLWLLYMAAPVLWAGAFTAYTRDGLLRAICSLGDTVGDSEGRIVEHVDQAAADTIIAVHNGPPPNQRAGAYDRPGPTLRSV